MSHNHEITKENAKKTLIVLIFTLVTMFVEVAYGYLTNSIALLADGFHMCTHVLALGLTYAAYILIQKFSNSDLFPNGTDKIGTLTAYTSSIFLGITGISIIIEACGRFINPLRIDFNDAILVAIIGLIVNLVCIFIMNKEDKSEGCEEHNREAHNDYNFRAAYYHILADAITSILAIAALIIGKYFNLICLDSFAGVLGGILIVKWAWGLLKNTIKVLVDMK